MSRLDPQSVLETVRALLRRNQIAFEEIEHPRVETSEEAAAARHMSVRQGAKSLLFKTDDRFGVFVLSGARALESRRIRKWLAARRTRFADLEELARLTGLEPGAVPPFGRPVFDLPIFADPSVLEPERIAFTAGLHTLSIVVASRDWQRVAKPEVFPFTREGRS